MRSRELTRGSSTSSGRFCSRYEHDGAEYDVCDSALNAILINELFEDEALEPSEKEQLLPRMLFPDAEAALAKSGPEGFWPMVVDVAWQAFGIDMDGSHAHAAEKPVFDWDEDAGRIRASLLQAYGIDWDEACRTMSYAAFCDLVAGLMEAGETPLQQAIYYRTAKPPKQTKHNGEYVRAFKARADHYRLGAKSRARTQEDAMKAANDAMASAFASEYRAASAREGVRHG